MTIPSPRILHNLAILLPTRLHPFDLALIVVYLIGITLFGLRFRKSVAGDKSLKNYFLADNTIPWWAIALSIVSAETSTLTIISVPGVAFAGDFGFLQIVLGYLLGRVVVAAIFLPRYFRGHMLTAYQLIDQRFGPTLHKVTAGLFLLTRAAAEGVRVFAVSIVVGIAIGTNDTLSIAIISALTLLYTFEGGMAAVIWTDVAQMAIYIGGTFVAISTLGSHVPGGWNHILAVTSAAHKLTVFHFAFNLTQSYTFWAGLLGGTFLTMASHGTDQLMVQRMLAARNLRESRTALLSSGLIILVQFTLFLLIGAGLYVFYGLHPATFASADRIFPTFIVREMPIGIAGLLIAAILAAAMSNLSAALNSLSSTTVVDFYMHWRPQADDRERLLISRSSTVLWAFVLFAIAVYSIHAGGKGHVVETGLSIASVAYGCLLGVFLLGTLTRYATQTGAILGMITGFTLNVYLWLGNFPIQFGPITIPHIAFTWYVLIGAIVTFAIGSLASLIFRKQSTHKATAATLILLLSLTHLASPQNRVPHLRDGLIVAKVGIGEADPSTGSTPPQPPITTHKPGAPYIASDVWASRKARPLFAAVTQANTLPTATEPNPQAQHNPEGAGGFSPTNTASIIDGLQPRALSSPPKTGDFTPIDTILNTAIAARKLPGAVLLIGHNNKIAYEKAYGLRKLAGEPGPTGTAPEPMTEDTIFDMASLTKCLATATAIMQLYEAGKLQFDDPVAKYLPDFAQNGKQNVTIRELLTHYSGLPPDVDLKDPWGLTAPDKAEGIRRAMASPLTTTPGTHFEYSDINFITLGALVEKLSGETEDVYALNHIFKPIGMAETRYLPIAKACGPDLIVVGAAITLDAQRPKGAAADFSCRLGSWYPDGVLPRTAPTTHDNEGNATTNPHFDMLTRGTVHDPTTRRMGGVAGHAGVFSTAHDISLYAQALLDKLLRNTGPFPLKQSTLQLMTQPEQPPTAQPGATIFTPDGQPTKGIATRGFGWDINTAFSRPRGSIFPIAETNKPGSFGHTGFTGTSLWIDPTSDTYVILLANAVHPRGNPPISALRGEVATAAAQALGLTPQTAAISPGAPYIDSDVWASRKARPLLATPGETSVRANATKPIVPTTETSLATVSEANPRAQHDPEGAGGFSLTNTASSTDGLQPRAVSSPPRSPKQVSDFTAIKTMAPGAPSMAEPATPNPEKPRTLTGIDTLEATRFAALASAAARHRGHLRLGLLTNQTGTDAMDRRTIDILSIDAPKAVPGLALKTLFSPEHGILGAVDTEHIGNDTDPTTGLPVISLYGPKDSDKRPKPEDLKNLDAIVIDLQDAGVRFYTYETVVGYFLEAAAQNHIEVIVLDRPNPIGGLQVQGPVSDPALESYINYMPLPVRHGLTLGELARYFNGERRTPSALNPNMLIPIAAPLTIVPLEYWSRADYFDATGLTWTNPSPNLRTLTAATLYPGLGFFDSSNVSVGRGTDAPFEQIGAGFTPKTRTAPAKPAWLKGPQLAAYLNARHIPGVTFAPTTFPVAEDSNHYPYHGQTIEGVKITLTDRTLFDAPELGIEILSALHHLYPADFNLPKATRLVANEDTMQAIANNDDPRAIAASWAADLATFKSRRDQYLLY